MKIANEIKKKALAHGKSISTLAKDLGVLQPQLSRTINNPRISLDDMQKIADAIGCKVGDFFSDEPGKNDTHIICPKCGAQIKITAE